MPSRAESDLLCVRLHCVRADRADRIRVYNDGGKAGGRSALVAMKIDGDSAATISASRVSRLFKKSESIE
jgi:hypothetical protein